MNKKKKMINLLMALFAIAMLANNTSMYVAMADERLFPCSAMSPVSLQMEVTNLQSLSRVSMISGMGCAMRSNNLVYFEWLSPGLETTLLRFGSGKMDSRFKISFAYANNNKVEQFIVHTITFNSTSPCIIFNSSSSPCFSLAFN
ncbi:hypothetical protein SAMD00019534_033210 [Acytostelium subglobosum LB1]|uniref:hypothetical protein n=1 Tax=Acytostelium subglobosum LB1 TaxID=1410327 RepID=UPI000644A9C7|nr:hypothetical protein SAMD00019534_033210 [Acytostelium subglobosum LB1]GAM20146.1 hypothetical protein SAMD00019534_033210 [Acytostelium subglobosum LB1]|eukprot:XP_012759667.1 hypothetical protein SAMD00019534_033210 [Acytostelium subglobosum LB1]